MNDELLKDFEKVIDFYKTKPKYLDVVGTELFKKMTELEINSIFNSLYPKRVNEYSMRIEDDTYYKCFLCNRFSADYYFNAKEIKLDEKTIRYMFPGNDDLCDRLIEVQKNKYDVTICMRCCDKYHYIPYKKCFKFDVYTWINRIVEHKPDEICEAEELLLKYYKFKNICQSEELFLSYYYEPKEEISDCEKNLLNDAHKQGKIRKAEDLLLDYYCKSGRMDEAKKLLKYRNLRELTEIKPDLFLNIADIDCETNGFKFSKCCDRIKDIQVEYKFCKPDYFED